MTTSHMPNGLPAPQGLYHPSQEHDACGLGFVANIDGHRSHDVVLKGIEVLINLTHRGVPEEISINPTKPMLPFWAVRVVTRRAVRRARLKPGYGDAKFLSQLSKILIVLSSTRQTIIKYLIFTDLA